MYILRIAFLSLLLFPFASQAQVNGCTDPSASNYDPNATVNDGSCTYVAASVTPYNIKTLSDTVQETSGLIWFNGEVWTHNDNTDTTLYALDTATGFIQQQVAVLGTANIDWEEITQDSNYIYIGDFGNNVNGNRTDLHILRIAKSSISGGSVNVDTIKFSYSNQTDFTPTGNNNTDFDCEAFIATGDSLYLFTKQWVSKKTSVYALPKTPSASFYVAGLKYTYDVQGMITGATYLKSKNLIALCGYDIAGIQLNPFVYLLYDFKADSFFSGNKRKIGVSQTLSQVEGITTIDGNSFFISNEKLSNVVTIPPRLEKIDLTAYLSPHYQTDIKQIINSNKLSIYPNPAQENLNINIDALHKGQLNVHLIDASGSVIVAKQYAMNTGTNNFSLPVPQVASGTYQCLFTTGQESISRTVVISK